MTAAEKARERERERGVSEGRYRPPGRGPNMAEAGGEPRGRGGDLPITESLLFPRIHYHQCPACVCECEGTRKGRPRPGHGRRGGRRGAALRLAADRGQGGGREGGGGSAAGLGAALTGPSPPRAA